MKEKNFNNKRGIALITVLMAIAILMVLLGAFLTINRTNFAQVSSSEHRDNAHTTCLAVFDYVQHRIEHDKTFGTVDFTDRQDLELGPDMRVTEVLGTRRLRGRIPTLNSTFDATIINNLNVDAVSPEGVPAESALIRITATSAGIRRDIETLVRVAPLFDASALSRGSMRVYADSFNVRSRDQYRNLIRSEGEVDIPDVLGGNNQTQFLEADSNSTDSKGMLWSKGDILSAGTSVTSDLATANTNAGGRFVPQAKQHFDIYDLRPEDIEVPVSSVAVRPGEYRFTLATATITMNIDSRTVHRSRRGTFSRDHDTTWQTTQEISVMEYYANPNDTVPAEVYRSVTRTDDIPVPPMGTAPGTIYGTTVEDVEIVYNTASINGSSVDVTEADVVYIDDSSSKVAVDLLSQEVRLPPGETVAADGDFKITTERGEAPTISLGSTSTERAAIMATGSIDLQAGVTQGYGTLIAANGDLNLRPDGSYNVDVTASGEDGLVAYAGQDVLLENPDDGGNWSFNGLVYARRNFDFDAKNADVKMEGTLVARNGNIDFRDAGTVDFIYNPDFLKALVRNLPENRLPLERVYWRE